MADKNSKAQIDLVANAQELNPELQRAERNINTFGQKIINIFSKVTASVSTIKDSVANAFESGVQSIKGFANKLNISQSALSAFNQVWYKSSLLLNTYVQQLNLSIAAHKALAKVNKLTGDSAGFATTKLIAYAHYLENITKFSHEATESAMQLIMHFRNIHGGEFVRATKAAQDLATELKMDLSSAAQFVAESLAEPATAIAKLSQLNVFFEASEKKVIDKLLAANKVVEAQQIILKKLEDSFGGAAKAAGETFAGKMDRLKNVLSRIGSDIGERVLSKLNNIIGMGEKGKTTFDAFLVEVNEWGKIAIAAVDTLLPKIINFTKSLQFNFDSVYTWLFDQTVRIFSGIQAAYQHTAKILDDVSIFIGHSFMQVWSGVSLIFTDIIPKAYSYMVDVFAGLSHQIVSNWNILTNNLKVLWNNAQIGSQQMLNSIYGELVKFGIKLMKWGSQLILIGAGIGKAIAWPLSFIISATLGDVEKLLDDFIDKYTDETNQILDKAKLEYKEFEDFKNPFDNIKPPDFEESAFWLKRSFNLTQEWDNLINRLNFHAGADFQQNMEGNKKVFDEFIEEVKAKSKEANDAFNQPDMKADFKRREDEKKHAESIGEKFQSGLTGLEELWRNMSSGGSPEVKAATENTEAVKANTEELKKKSLMQQRQERHEQFVEDQKKKSKTKEGAPLADEYKQATRDKNTQRAAEINRRMLVEAQKRYEKEHGLKPGEGKNLFADHLREQKAMRDAKKEDKSIAMQQRRDELHNKLESQRAKQRELADTIKGRMLVTGEKYGEARKNIMSIRDRQNKPAEELARQKADKNNDKQVQNQQHQDTTKHLSQIARNTQVAANELNQTKRILEKDSNVKIGVV